MITTKKNFLLKKSELGKKFRVENNCLDLAALLDNSGYEAKPLGKIADPHRNERNRKETAQSFLKYVQISDIDVHLGRIKSFKKYKGSEAPNNARRIMRYGDVLISTRRPTRGAIVTVPKEFDGEICTVFFTSLTIKDWDEVDPWYLSLFLRTSLGRFQFQSMITETAYPVISDEDVESIVVLIPHINVQRMLAQTYSIAVDNFFKKLNEAHILITDTRQHIENNLLGMEAEILSCPRFGPEVEELLDDNGVGLKEDVAAMPNDEL